MLVFKFGGASVKDADAVKNVSRILGLYPDQKLLVVISAMGKTTNSFEAIVNALWNNETATFQQLIEATRQYHLNIMDGLFANKSEAIYNDIHAIFDQLQSKSNDLLSDKFDFEYDQIVSLGEVISTKIVAAFLKTDGHRSAWVDARKLIRTNHTYRDGNVDWKTTQRLIETRLMPQFETASCVITQGFLGHTEEGFTTTLGREGSDYTAGILAFCIHSESVTIWKDVPGMLNADPKWFNDTVKLDQISFKEAIELSYYGASIIHPKTIKPLQNKQIPLYVKSFNDPHSEGTVIQENMAYDDLVPSYIFKINQVLFSIMPKDFSFIVEENLSQVFELLAASNVKINLMQNSALSFSFIVDAEKINIDHILSLFRERYEIKFNDHLELVTIRHYDQNTIDKITAGKNILLEQRDRQTVRVVMKGRLD